MELHLCNLKSTSDDFRSGKTDRVASPPNPPPIPPFQLWGRSLKSLKFLALAPAIALAAASHAQSVRVLGFDPNNCMLRYVNTWPVSDPTYSVNLTGGIFGTGEKWQTNIGSASSGLCGGMAYEVADCFNARLIPPRESTNPRPGSAEYGYITARLANSTDFDDCFQAVTWIDADDGKMSNWEINDEWKKKIKPALDSNQVVPLNLVGGKEDVSAQIADGFKLGMGGHQVMAWGYDLVGSQLTIHIYDPNHAYNPVHPLDGENQTIKLDISHPGSPTPLTFSDTTYNTRDHYKGFFQSHYTYHDPRTPANGAFVLSVASSPGLGNLAPLPMPVEYPMFRIQGAPLHYFKGGGVDVQTYPVSHVPQALLNYDPVQYCIRIHTTDVNLDEGQHCDLTLNTTKGALQFPDINAGLEWKNNTTHTVVLPMYPNHEMGEIQSVVLRTNMPGGVFGKNWKVGSVELIAYLLPGTKLPRPPQVATVVDVHGNPAFYFKGGGTRVETYNANPAAPAQANEIVDSLQVSVSTGDDNLDSGQACDLILHTRRGDFTFPNVNSSEEWANNTTRNVSLPISSGLALGDILSLSVRTNMPGGVFGKNWKMNGLVLTAQIEPGNPSAPLPPPPTFQDVNLFNRSGNPILYYFKGGGLRSQTYGIAPAGPPLGSKAVTKILLTFVTGDDNLDGGQACNVILTTTRGEFRTNNVNNSQEWKNHSTSTVQLGVPPGLKLADITGFRLETNMPGGFSGKNWKLDAVSMKVTVQN